MPDLSKRATLNADRTDGTLDPTRFGGSREQNMVLVKPGGAPSAIDAVTCRMPGTTERDVCTAASKLKLQRLETGSLAETSRTCLLH